MVGAVTVTSEERLAPTKLKLLGIEAADGFATKPTKELDDRTMLGAAVVVPVNVIDGTVITVPEEPLALFLQTTILILSEESGLIKIGPVAEKLNAADAPDPLVKTEPVGDAFATCPVAAVPEIVGAPKPVKVVPPLTE